MTTEDVTLTSIKDTLPEGSVTRRGRELLIEVHGHAVPGQPVKVLIGRDYEMFHLAERMYSTIQGTTIGDATFLIDMEEVRDAEHNCSVCGKPALVPYVNGVDEWSCLMCHYWLSKSGCSVPAFDKGSGVYRLSRVPHMEPSEGGKAHLMVAQKWGPFDFLLALNW